MSHRCPTCGRMGLTWTDEAVLDAIRAWNTEHGQPPRYTDWTAADYGHPSSFTVRTIFGTMTDAVAAAGLQPRTSGKRWSKELILHAIFEFNYERGRLPKAREWASGDREHGRYPSTHTVIRYFGSFTEAIEAAGYTPVRALPRRLVKAREAKREYMRQWRQKQRAAQEADAA